MKRFILKPLALGFCVTLAALAPLSAGAGLQQQMDSLFDSMTNVTDPGVFETQSRGAIAGGRVVSKNPIMNVNFANLQVPSWKAGCGGVDMFGGSFSFINADQFVQLLRSVAANATGYAFQLALSNVFPDGAELLSELQSRIQDLNQMMGNSCQLAQGVINDSTRAMGFAFDNDVRTQATISGAMTDFFAGFSENDGTSARKTLKDNQPLLYAEMTGNIVFKELKKQRVDLWFSSGAGAGGSFDLELVEALMSLTGTVVVGAGTSDDDNLVHTLPGGVVTLQDMIEGGEVRVYDCSSIDPDGCPLEPGTQPTKTITLVGLRTKINEVYLGDNATSIGLIQKWATGAPGVIATPQEQAVSVSTGHAGALLRRLAVLSPAAANSLVSEISGALALTMLEERARDMFRAAETSFASSRSSHAVQAREEINRSRAQLTSEAQALRAHFGSVSDLTDKATQLLDVVEKYRYLPETQLINTGGGLK